MPLQDSPLFRQGNEFARTILELARFKAYKQQLADEQAARLRTLDLDDEKLFHEKVERARADMGNRSLVENLRNATRLDVQEAPPSPTGEAPLVQPGYGQPITDVPTRGVDVPALIEAQLLSPSARAVLSDAQTLPWLQGAGVVQSPEAIKLRAQLADLEARRPAREAALRTMGRTSDEARGQAGVSPEDFGRYALSDTRAQNAETNATIATIRQQLADLARDKEMGNTVMSGILAQKLMADTGVSLARKQDLLGQTNPAIAIIERNLATAAANRARAAETNAGVPFVAPTKQAKIDKTRKETEQIGTPKAGKPSESDKRVATWVENYRYGEEFADQPEEKGWFSNTPAVSRREAAAADVEDEQNLQLHDIKMRAYQEVFGNRQGGATPPTEEVRQDPKTGKRYVKRNGKVVEVP